MAAAVDMEEAVTPARVSLSAKPGGMVKSESTSKFEQAGMRITFKARPLRARAARTEGWERAWDCGCPSAHLRSTQPPARARPRAARRT